MLVERNAYEAYLDGLRQVFTAFWPKGALHPEAQWGKMINSRHFERVRALEGMNGVGKYHLDLNSYLPERKKLIIYLDVPEPDC